MNKTKLGHGRMRREMGLYMPKKPNKLNGALNLVHDFFLPVILAGIHVIMFALFFPKLLPHAI